jgi:hypothetical protein
MASHPGRVRWRGGVDDRDVPQGVPAGKSEAAGHTKIAWAMKAVMWFGGLVVLIVVVCGALLSIPFSQPAERRAIGTSAVIALIVQLFAFVIARVVSGSNFFAGWITGVALRFVALIVYAYVGVKLIGMPAAAALISLATFLFVSTLVEPKLLTK